MYTKLRKGSNSEPPPHPLLGLVVRGSIRGHPGAAHPSLLIHIARTAPHGVTVPVAFMAAESWVLELSPGRHEDAFVFCTLTRECGGDLSATG